MPKKGPVALVRTLRGDAHGGEVATLSFSPDGRTLAAGFMDKMLRVWNVETGELLWTIQADMSAEEVNGGVASVSFAQDGRMLASGGWDGAVRLWDANSGALRKALQGDGWDVRAVAFSPDGRTLASGHSNGTVRLWDPATGDARFTLDGLPGSVSGVAFTPDGNVLVASLGGWAAGLHGAVYLWDAVGGQLVQKLDLSEPGTGLWSLAINRDGRLIAAGGQSDKAYVWDRSSGELLYISLEGHGSNVNVAFSPARDMLLEMGLHSWLYDMSKAERAYDFEPNLFDGMQPGTFSPDGMLLAIGDGSDICLLKVSLP